MNNITSSENLNQNNSAIWNEKFSNEIQQMKELGRRVTAKLASNHFQAIESSIMIRAALFYARKGWYVIPVYGIRDDGSCACGQLTCAAGKHPKIGNWQNEATRDENKIKSWFSQKFTNIAIVTGKKSGLIVVDVDARNGGAETMKQWEANHGKLPDTLIVHTGSSIDSLHLYFKYPETGFSTKPDFLKGVDIKSDGGYVVASPSLHKSGRQYRCDVVLHPQKIPLAAIPGNFLNPVSQNRENDFKSSGGSHPKPPKAIGANLRPTYLS